MRLYLWFCSDVGPDSPSRGWALLRVKGAGGSGGSRAQVSAGPGGLMGEGGLAVHVLSCSVGLCWTLTVAVVVVVGVPSHTLELHRVEGTREKEETPSRAGLVPSSMICLFCIRGGKDQGIIGGAQSHSGQSWGTISDARD